MKVGTELCSLSVPYIVHIQRSHRRSVPDPSRGWSHRPPCLLIPREQLASDPDRATVVPISGIRNICIVQQSTRRWIAMAGSSLPLLSYLPVPTRHHRLPLRSVLCLLPRREEAPGNEQAAHTGGWQPASQRPGGHPGSVALINHLPRVQVRPGGVVPEQGREMLLLPHSAAWRTSPPLLLLGHLTEKGEG